jgi:hypothetical protein
VLQLCCWLPELLIPTRNPIWLQFIFHKLLRLLTPYWCIGLTTCAAVVILRWLETRPMALGVPIFGLALVTIVRKARVARVLASAIIWSVTLQAAFVMAAVNGLRRQWDVWNA